MKVKGLALKVDDFDNVATVFSNDILTEDRIIVRDKKGSTDEIVVNADIPFGHKVALKDISCGDHIMKYGESIGAASCEIKRGDYVHVHNMVALRGRGDLKQ